MLRQFTAQKRELQSIVALLTGVVARACKTNERAVASLETVGKQLRHASQLEDIRAVKVRLEDCLSAVQAEAERQATAAADTSQALEASASSATASAAVASSGCDPVTGLPDLRRG